MDFKKYFTKYHYKATNASTEEDKKILNDELKLLYDTLTEDNKKLFNIELQKYLVGEYAKFSSFANNIDLSKDIENNN